MTSDKPTLFEYAGGAPAFLKLTDAFYAKVKADPDLQPVFKDFTDEHARRVALWLGEVFRGPQAYSEQRGGHLTILGAHAGRHLSKALRDRWVELMIETARDVLPRDDEFQERFRSYIEYGADIALRVSQNGPGPNNGGSDPKVGLGTSTGSRALNYNLLSTCKAADLETAGTRRNVVAARGGQRTESERRTERDQPE